MNRLRALLIGFAATVGAGGIAAYNGVFSTPTPPAGLASTPAPAANAAKVEPAAPAADLTKVDPAAPAVAPAAAKTEPAAAATEVAKADPQAAEPAAKAELPAAAVEPAPAIAAEMAAPTFDILRVEPDGSVLIAGKAAKAAQVDVLSGADVLGTTKAEGNGDFAIILTNPLKPGDYQLVLRATGTDGKAAASSETATVSVPATVNGPVLALVEEPGKPSRIITTPEKPVETAQAAPEVAPIAPAADAPAAPADTVPTEVAPAATAEVAIRGEVKAPAAEPAPPAAVAQSVTIEAVETEDGKIFIAGSAKGVVTVRLYVNDQALGDAKPGEGDRFLGEFTKDLPAGDYIVRAEGLAADGDTMIATSSVPYQIQAEAPAVADATALAAQTPAAQTPAAETPAAETPVAETPAASTDIAAAAPAAIVPAKPKAVIIRRGDTLWQISRRVYGRGVRYSTIYLANQDAITNPNRIFPGQVFKVPEKTAEGDAADPAEIDKRAAPEENTAVQ